MAKKKTTRAPKRSPARTDGWQNAMTGFGVFGRDKTVTGTSFVPELVAQETAEQLWRGDDIIARIVETVPNEMLREGFEVIVDNEKEQTEETNELLKTLDVETSMRTGLKYARAYGGAGVLLGANEGIDPKGKTEALQLAYRKSLIKPLDEERLQSIDFLNVFTPRELQPVTYYADPLLPNYGSVETYRIVPIYSPPGGGFHLGKLPIVHESRILRIPGEETTRRAMLTNVQPGWPDSVFVRCMRVVANFQQAWQGVGIMLQDFSFATLKLKGLAELLTMSGPTTDLTSRAAALEMARSIARVSIIDAEEEYKRESTNVTGLSDLLERFAERLAAAAQMPVSLLFGQAPGGLNATGDIDLRWFYDQVAAMQKRKLQPQLEYLVRLLFLAKQQSPTGGIEPDCWKVHFPALWQQTDLEQAQVRKTQADADVAYINAGVLTPEEVATSRFGGPAWSSDTHLDEEARDEMGSIINPETGEAHAPNGIAPEPEEPAETEAPSAAPKA